MKTLQKILSLTALILLLLIVKESLGSSALTLDGRVISFFIAILVPLFILVSIIKHNHKDGEAIQEEIKHVDMIEKQENSFSVFSLVSRILILFVILIGVDIFINENKNLVNTNFIMMFILIVVVPILILFKTPFGDKLKGITSKNEDTYDPKKQHYTVNESEHHEDHIFEQHEYQRNQIHCPYCDSTSVTTEKREKPGHFRLRSGVSFLLAAALDTEHQNKNHYICLNCNKKW